MKGSAVVQGLKGLVSKLHPPLPLDRRESQRLLTALTDSFRQHLDQVHPPGARDDASQKLSAGGDSKATTQPFHSSAATADRLLSSVLTSPLLARRSSQSSKAIRDYASIKNDLKTSSDPMTLLEEYHSRGAATLPIATLCLEHFNSSIASLSKEAKLGRIHEYQPGRRVLLWLWRANLYTTDAFTESRQLISLLAHFMVMEDLEQYLWDWMKLDIGNLKGVPGGKSVVHTQLHKYRWKGDMLHAMVKAKLQGHFVNDGSVDAALDVFFTAADASPWSLVEVSTRSIPLRPAGNLLHRELTTRPERYARTNVDHYDRFTELVNRWHGKTSLAERHKSTLKLWHPRNPTGLPAYNMFKRLCGPSDEPLSKTDEIILRNLDNTGDGNQRALYFKVAVRTVHILEAEGLHTEKQWMERLMISRWPDLAQHSASVIGLQAQESPSLQRATPSRGLPFPAFTDPIRS